MALLEYLNKTAPASIMDEIIPPVAPQGHTVSEIRSVTPEQPNYVDAISKKGMYDFFKDFYQKPDLEKEEKITRRERALSLLGDIANLGGQMFASTNGARQFASLNSQLPRYNERLQRLREAKRAYDADYQNKSLSMIFRDYDQKRADEYRNKQLEIAGRKEVNDRLWNKYKLDSEIDYKKGKDKGLEIAKEEALKETKRHNSATEAIGRTNADANMARANKDIKKEVAYVTKYGDVTFNNPKNKRAATFSVLEIMRNGAPGAEREKIDKLLYEAQNGDMNSYSKAEMYVSQNLNSDPIALKHLYELARQYGHVSVSDNQKQLRDSTRGVKNNKSLGLNW